MYNFLFHRVSAERDSLWDPVDPKLFEKCVKFITNKYELVTIEEFISNKAHQHERLASIVFDDGYKDNLEIAAPILEKYNAKASFYIVTDCINNNELTWTHVLEHLFQNTSKRKLELPFDFLSNENQINNFVNAQETFLFAKNFLPGLKKLSHEKRTLVIEKIKENFDDVELPKLMMNWDDVRQLKNSGHTIGSHTVTHSMLGTMNQVDQFNEMKLSGDQIMQQLGDFPKTISYPVGSYNEFTEELAQKAGYELGLAVNQNVYNPIRDGNFEIPRINISNENWFKTKMRLTNRLEEIKKLIRYK